MTYQILRHIQCPSNLSADSDLLAVRIFMDEHGHALANAARFLGGNAASGRVLIFLESLRDAVRLTRTQRKQLVSLHRLLTLQNTADPDRPEAALFAEIDPNSTQVDDICLLSDALKGLLNRIASASADLLPEEVTPITPRKRKRRAVVSRPIPRERRHPKRLPRIGGVA